MRGRLLDVFVAMLVCCSIGFVLASGVASASVPSTAIRYSYDADGHLKGVVNPASESALYSWDPAGNLSAVSHHSATTLSVSTFSPSQGAAGETVTIYGTGFSTTPASDTVKFHGTAATVSAATIGSLTVKVPTGVTTGTVTVQTTTEGPATSGETFAVLPEGPQSAPVVSSLSSTLVEAGASVTATGTNFDARSSYDAATLNQTRAQVTAATATTTTFTVPASTSSGHVSVGTIAGSAAGPDLYVVPPGYTTGQVSSKTRISLGSSATVTTAAAEKVGLVIFDASGGQKLSLVLSHSTISSGLVKIFSPQGVEIATESITESEDFLSPVTLPTTGTYTMLVAPQTPSTGGSVKLTPYLVSDVTGSLAPSTEGAAKSFTLGTPGQRAVYTVSATAGEEVSLKTSGGSIAEYTTEWLEPDGAVLASAGFTGNSYMESVDFPTTGTYTLVVAPWRMDLGSLTITAYKDVTGTITPSSGGGSSTVSLPGPGQHARLTFTGTAGQRVSLATSMSSIVGGTMSILSPEGTVVGSEVFGVSAGFLAPVTLPATGTYTVLLATGAETGSVKVSAYLVTDVTGTLTPTTGGASKSVVLGTPGQRALYTVSGSTGEEVNLTMTSSTFGEYAIEWLNSAGEVLADQGYVGAENYMEAVRFPATGTYTLVVDPWAADTGSMTLTAYIGAGHHLAIRRPGTSLQSNAVQAGAPPRPVAQAPVLAGGLPELLPGLASAAPAAMVDFTSALRPASRTGLHVGRKQHLPGLAAAGARAFLPASLRTYRPPGQSGWQPGVHNRQGSDWIIGGPLGPWLKLPMLRAPDETTALAGQVLDVNGLPLAGLEVSIEGSAASARTDVAGRFLLVGLTAGHHVLLVEGNSLPARRRYGIFEIGVDVVAHQTTQLGYPIWLTPLDAAGNATVDSPTAKQRVLTTPQIPGLEVRIPAGTVIHDAAGSLVRNLNITAVPVDRPPFPLPLGVSVPLYFTVQPGRAYLSKGAQIVYPNYEHLPPGQRVDFWNYDAGGRGWYIYGHGSVTPDGKQVVPDPGVRVWEFTGAMVSGEQTPPPRGPRPHNPGGGDPVDLQTGLFNYRKTDLVIPDTIPIVIEQDYRQSDLNSYSFGVGETSIYDMRLYSTNNFQEVNLVLPNGGQIHYVRTSGGTGYIEAEYHTTGTLGEFNDSTIKWNGNGWNLTLTNGMTYVFGVLNPLDAIRNRFGQQLTITRERGQGGNITQITSPHGRWAKFTYDSFNRVTEIKDNSGRSLKYAYNSGLLEKLTDAAGRITNYEYNASNELTAVKDGRGKTYVQTEYDAHERVAKQTLGDGGVFHFAYTLAGSGEVEATTVTDPRGIERKLTFNTEGATTSETKALGSSIEAKTTYEREPGSGLVLSETDPRGRKTTYQYDSSGNVTQKVLLAGTASARTLKYTYEPGTNEIAAATDALNHTTTYRYGTDGELLSVTDPLSHKTSYEYNSSGQVTALTNPLNKTEHFAYENGSLASITDQLGRRSTRWVDSVGRLATTTTPGGQRTTYEYNPDEEITKITDPLGNSTSYEYDGDGDLIGTTDPRLHKSTDAYDAMDRLEKETDPLEHSTTAVYNTDGDITQLTDRRGKVSKFSYDALNRLTEAKYAVSGETSESTIKYEYDNGNRLTKIIDSASGTYTPEYDEFNRLKSLATPGGTISYAYDEADRRTSMTVPGQEPVTYGYDEANRLKEVKRGTQLVSLGYDAANRPTSRTLVNGVEELYGYDEANELTSIAYKKSATTLGELDYAYDQNGRREAMWGSFARSGLPEAVTSASYNADNELTERNSQAYGYDAAGNMTSTGGSEYTYNARNQLSAITGTISASFGYDPFGRRISKTLAGTNTKDLYDGPNVVQETQGTAVTNLLTGLGTDETYARTTSTATETLLTEALNSTVALTGGTGTVATSYTYDPFGTTTQEGTASANPFQYTGREDDGHGLYSNRARVYSPTIGRFLTEDPLGQEANGPNLYLYTLDSPTNAIDPYGTRLSLLEPIGPVGPGGPGPVGPGPGPGPGPGGPGPGGPGPGGPGPGGPHGPGWRGPGPGGPIGGGPGPGSQGEGEQKAIQRLELVELENEEEAREESEELPTLGDEIDEHIQQVCDLGGPAALVGLRPVPNVGSAVVFGCGGFTGGNLFVRPKLGL
jgi:RHS repeat-associated protein